MLVARRSGMSSPVTQKELRAELERYATKVDLELWGGALLSRMDSHYEGMLRELARFAKAIDESVTAR
jgi:hypothetical protein